MKPFSPEFQQRIIDHEVRLTRARLAAACTAAASESRRDDRRSAAEEGWVRQQAIAMLASAPTAGDLAGLGLSDAFIRDAGLGTSLRAAWRAFHRPGGRPHPPRRHAPVRWRLPDPRAPRLRTRRGTSVQRA